MKLHAKVKFDKDNNGIFLNDYESLDQTANGSDVRNNQGHSVILSQPPTPNINLVLAIVLTADE